MELWGRGGCTGRGLNISSIYGSIAYPCQKGVRMIYTENRRVTVDFKYNANPNEINPHIYIYITVMEDILHQLIGGLSHYP